ncbi:MAG: peptidoglycan-binding protein [Clostridia bacterium]|nr:peptidoglycan-binding protein [Clostridia bacterium]
MDQPMTNRDAIRNLQRYLRRISYEDNRISPVPIDGIFDDRTEEALLAFQRMMGLPATGRADEETFRLLYAEYDRIKKERDLRLPLDFFPSVPENYEAAIGERSAFVTLLQFMLGELTFAYDAFDPPPLSGVLDEETEEAILRFQAIQGIPVTGRVDRHTWNRLSEEYKNYLT